ncbi:MAG: hypothetical protein V1770_02240 [bacterium]
MRKTHFYYEMIFSNAWLVHRGVSEHGRKLTPEKRRKFWGRNFRNIFHGEVEFDRWDNTVPWKIKITPQGLQAMREKSFVIVSNPEKPRVWTPKRIMKFAKKVQSL